MEIRLNVYEKGKKALAGLFQMGQHLNSSPVERRLLLLVYHRVSQINGCAMCLDIHSKDLLADGEEPQRIFVLDAWRDAPFYSEREKAALAYAEELALPSQHKVSDGVFTELRSQFSEEEIIDLTIAIITVGGYNRLNLAFGAPVGTYKVGAYA